MPLVSVCLFLTTTLSEKVPKLLLSPLGEWVGEIKWVPEVTFS